MTFWLIRLLRALGLVPFLWWDWCGARCMRAWAVASRMWPVRTISGDRRSIHHASSGLRCERCRRDDGPLSIHGRCSPWGKGVFELKDADDATWYRLLYLARIEDTIYVLDCFTKNTRKTDSNTLSTARARLSSVRVRIQERKRDGKDNRNG